MPKTSGDPIAARYAESLFASAKAEDVVPKTLEQLTMLGEILEAHPPLGVLLASPGIGAREKFDLLNRVFAQGFSPLIQAFLQMVIGMGRSPLLLGMIEALRQAVDTDQGRMHVVVRTAHPLPEAVLTRITRQLEQREQKQIELETQLVPDLLGGLQIVLDHRVFDSSVRRQLTDLKERLATVRVH